MSQTAALILTIVSLTVVVVCLYIGFKNARK